MADIKFLPYRNEIYVLAASARDSLSIVYIVCTERWISKSSFLDKKLNKSTTPAGKK